MREKQNLNIESVYQTTNRGDEYSIREEEKEDDDIEMDVKTQEDFELSKKQFSNQADLDCNIHIIYHLYKI